MVSDEDMVQVLLGRIEWDDVPTRLDAYYQMKGLMETSLNGTPTLDEQLLLIDYARRFNEYRIYYGYA